MYWINLIMVIVFWLGVFLTHNLWGVNSFAIFKLIAGTMAMMFYLRFLIGFLDESLISFLKDTVLRIIIPLIVEISFLIFATNYLPETKGKLNLMIVVGTGGIGTVLGFITLYFTSSYYKKEFNYYLAKVIPKLK